MRKFRFRDVAKSTLLGYLSALQVALLGMVVAQVVKYPGGYTGYPPFSWFDVVVLPTLGLFALWAPPAFALSLIAARAFLRKGPPKLLFSLIVHAMIGFLPAFVLMATFIWPYPGNWFRAGSWAELLLESAQVGFIGAAAGGCVGAWAHFFSKHSYREARAGNVSRICNSFWTPLFFSFPFFLLVVISVAA